VGARESVFVIGGGPAGLAVAIAASQKGFKVTVADGSEPPIDKACGEGLMPATLDALARLGIFFSGVEGRGFRGIRFLDRDKTADAVFPDGTAVGIRRTILHQKMVARAEECGVTFLWGTSVSGITLRSVIAGGRTHPARWIIGADGSGSRVRKWCGLDERKQQDLRFAFRRHFQVKPWTDLMEIYWGDDMQAYVTPLGPEEVCVAVISRDPGVRMDAIVTQFPALTALLHGAIATSTERGAITGTHRLHRVFRESVALIGDASGSIDAITGEGLCLGFRQAEKLADAIEFGELARYQTDHNVIARRPEIFAWLMLALSKQPTLRRHVMQALASDSTIFSRLLSLHVGTVAPLDFAATGAQFGWNVLASWGKEGSR
jgi:flavin-dependent dehydrogenase